jgi:hypothetical protein
METVCDGTTELFEAALRGAHPAETRSGGLTARDLVLVLCVAAKGRAAWGAAGLARELGLSAYEVVVGLERARRVGILDEEKRAVRTAALMEFLTHGLQYVFPAEISGTRRGIPTAELAGRFVWPTADGEATGLALEPLDPCARRTAGAARELLSLVDTLRAGRVWERMLALRELRRSLHVLSRVD